MAKTIAALDFGSNSFHLAIAERTQERELAVKVRVKERVQLGRGAFDTGRIDDDAFARGLAAVRKLRGVLAAARPEVVLGAATSVFRDAQNGAEFVREAAALLGHPIDIISGEEEARLVGLGTLQTIEVARRPTAIFDLGGGSTEVILADARGRPVLTRSLPVGTLRLGRSLDGAVTSRAASLRELERTLESLLAPTLAALARARVASHVLSCGSARKLARLARRLEVAAEDDGTAWLSHETLKTLQALLGTMSTRERATLSGSDPARADTLLVAATVLKVMSAQLAVPRFMVASAGLREGMLADYVARAAQQPRSYAVAL